MQKNFTKLITKAQNTRIYPKAAVGLLWLFLLLIASSASAQTATLYPTNSFTNSNGINIQNVTPGTISVTAGELKALGGSGSNNRGYNGYVAITSQQFNLYPGVTYNVTFNARAVTSAGQVQVLQGATAAGAGSSSGVVLGSTTVGTAAAPSFTITFTVPTIASGQFLALQLTSNVNNADLYIDDLTITQVCPNLAPPTVASTTVTRCDIGNVTLSSTVVGGNNPATGATNRWYTASLGGSVLATGANYSPNLTDFNLHTYYVGSYNSLTGCESSQRVAVTARAIQIPTAAITTTTPTEFCSGGSVLLTAVADPASPAVGTYTYQWRNGGTIIPNETSATYSAATSGNYTVVIGTSVGGCTSAPSTAVAVTANPIPAAPTNVSVTPTTFCGSGTPTLNATVGTNGTTVRWYLVPSGGSFVGTGASYTPTAAISTTTTYYASSYNATTTCESSSRVAVTVTVNPVPVAAITQGATASYCAGGSTTLTAQTATGNTYVWFKNNTQLPNQPNSNALVVNEPGSYSVRVTNNGCSSSSVATVVSETPLPTAVINPPTKTSLCAGESVTLSAETGTGNTYVWTRNGNTISGATDATLSVDQAGDYRIVVKANNCSATSEAVTITVNPVPVAIITAEGPLAFCEGGYVTLNGPQAPTGQTYTYEWFQNGISVQSGSALSYRAEASGSYTLTVTSLAGCSNTSPARVITVGTPSEAAITYIGETAFCVGGSIELRATQAPTGQPAYTYQWLKDEVAIPAAQGGTSRIYTATTTGSYQVVVSNGSCSKTSVALGVTAYPQPTASISGNDQFQCAGPGNSFTITGTFVGSGATWSSNNTNFTIETLSYSLDPVTGQGQTTAKVTTTGAGSAIISLTASRSTTGCREAVATKGLTVRPLPDASVLASGPTTFCTGEFVNLSAPDVTGYTYSWFKEGQTASVGSDRILKVSVAGNYFVEVTSNTCKATSAVTAVTVNPLPTAVVTPIGPVAICEGGAVVLNATSDTGTNFTWFRGTQQVGTGASYEATLAGSYTVRVTNGSCGNVSAATVVTVNPSPTASIEIIGNTNICQGSTVTLRAPAAPQGQTYAYQWLLGGAPIAAQATSMDYVASASGNYTVRVTNTTTTLNCNTTTATPVAVTVSPTPSFTVVNPAAVCAPGTVNLTAAGIKTNASEVLTYTYWTNATATTALSNPSAVATTNTYYIKGTSGAGCSVIKPVTVTIYPRPTVTVTSPSTCAGTPATIAATVNGGVGPYTYTWTVPSGVPAPGNVASFSASVAGTYSVLVADSRTCGSVSSSGTLSIAATPATPTISGITANSIIYTGERVNGSYSRTLVGSAPGTGNTGAFTGPGITSAGVFTPCNVLAAGENSKDIVITYTVRNTSTGCTSAVNVPVTVRRSTYTIVLQTVPFPVCQSVNTDYTARVLRDAVVVYPAFADIRTVPITVVSFQEDVSSLFDIDARKNNGNYNRGATFSNSSLSSTDYYEARATPIAGNLPGCASLTPFFSNRIYLGTPDLDIAVTNPGSICPNTSVTFTASTTSVSPGSYSYQWTVNGNPVSGATAATFTTSTLQNGDRVAVNFSVAASGCGTRVSTNSITMVVVTPQTVSSNGSYCAGTSGATITVGSSQIGVNYQLVSVANNGTTTNVGTVRAGTGGSLSFINQLAGTYSVVPVAANGSACTKFNNITITETPLPNLFSVTGGSSYCAGDNGVAIGLSGSQVGITYKLMRGTTEVASVTRTSAGPFSFANQTVAGTYDVIATTVADGTTTAACPRTMTGNAIVTVNPLPIAQTITTPNGTNYCVGSGAGVQVGLSGSQSGVTYTLLNGATAVASVAGTGTEVTFPGNIPAGTYTVGATNTSTSCSSTMPGSVTIVGTTLPTLYTVTGGGSYCAQGSQGRPVGLNGSQSGVNYQLLRGGVAVGSPVAGTGTVLDFGNQATAGTYTVVATTVSNATTAACPQTMTGSVTVTVTEVTTQSEPILDVMWTSNDTQWKVTALENGKNIIFPTTGARYVWYRRDVPGAAWGDPVYVSTTTNVYMENAPATNVELKVEVFNGDLCLLNILTNIGVTPYPVEIIYLNASRQGNNVLLEWATASEQNNQGFEVQVSEDGASYRKLDFVPSKNSNSSTKQVYTFLDKESGKFGTRYYRLKQLDTDGTTEFFGPKAVNFGSVASKVIAFPNPFHDEVTLDIAAEADGEALIVVTDAVGKKLLERKVAVSKGFTTEKLNLSTNLPKGLYIIRTQVGGYTQYIKMIKE